MENLSKEPYVYAVTRVHANEQRMLRARDLEELMAAGTVNEAFRRLSDWGWGSPDLSQNDADALAAYETKKTWALLTELLPDMTPFNVFLLGNDYHNLKAAIKLAYSGQTPSRESGCFIERGTVSVDAIIEAVRRREFSELPKELALAGREASEELSHTGSGQACDIIVDKAALAAIDAAGKASPSELFKSYATLTVDAANLKIAARGCRMKKSKGFIARALAPAGSLDIGVLGSAAAEGMQALGTSLRATPYAGAAGALTQSPPAFERWFDNRLMELIKPQRYNYFTIEPLAAYLLGRENEIRMVRLILSAKQNRLGADVLRERLRESYV